MLKRILAIVITAAAVALPCAALNTTYYAQTSRLASGRWVKIKTTSEGLYALTYDDLRTMGFDNPAAVQVYGSGGTAQAAQNHAFSTSAPDDISPVATLHSNNRIVFFGQGDNYATATRVKDKYSSVTVVRNFYDTASYYFLSDCEGALPVPVCEEFQPSTLGPSTSHMHIDMVEEELQNPTGGGVSFLGKKYKEGETGTYTFNIRNYAPNKAMACGSLVYVYGVSHSNTTTGVSLGMTVSDNIEPMAGAANFNNTLISPSDNAQTIFQNATGNVYFNPASGADLTNAQIKLNIAIPSGLGITYAAADRVVLRYPRANRLDPDTPWLIFNHPIEQSSMGHSVAVDGATEGDLAVWNVDNLNNIYSYPLVYDTESGRHIYTLDHSSTGRTVVFRPSAQWPKPEVVGQVSPQNLHGMDVPHMLIICTEALMPQAQRLAQLHRTYQGMDVAVVDHRLIYNEFSSGSRDADAYRRLAKMLYDRDPAKFRYLLFVGPTYFDNRSLTCTATDRLMCYTQDNPSLLNTNILNYTPDAFFGMLADNYKHTNIHLAPTQVAVGRIPCQYDAEARAYINKVERYLATPPSARLYSTAVLAAGSGDNGTHAKQAADLDSIMRVNNPYINRVNVYAEMFSVNNKTNEYARHMRRALVDGSAYFCYCGHGSPTSIQGWYNSDVLNTPYPDPTFAVFASCDQFDFDHTTPGIMASMLFYERGGAIAGIGSGRGVYLSANPLAVTTLTEAYAKAKHGDTYGDVMVEGRNLALAQQNTVTSVLRNYRNLLSFNYAGDPALPVPVPTHKAVLTRIAGEDVAEGTTHTVQPLKTVAFEGSVLTADGDVDASFNGTATVNVYDGLRYTTTASIAGESSYKTTVVPNDSELLASKDVEVTGGKYSGTIIVPAPSCAGVGNKVMITAQSLDGAAAIGRHNNITVADCDSPVPGENDLHTAPRILSLAVEGGRAVAVIDPSESGLSFRASDIYSGVRVTVDNTVAIAVTPAMTSRTTDGNVSVAVELPTLSEGMHSVSLLAVNNVGLRDNLTIDHACHTAPAARTLTVAEEPARTKATIDCPEATNPATLRITDSRGHTVLSVASPVLPYEWDLTDSRGTAVPDGRYKATLLMPGAHATTDIIVLK